MKSDLRLIITTARRMMRMHGWSRREAIAFALELKRRGRLTGKPSRRREMSGETREYLDHRNRSMTR